MYSYVHNINPYVEAKSRYLCDKLLVKITEGSAYVPAAGEDPEVPEVPHVVTVQKADTLGAAIADAADLVNKSFAYDDLASATKYYDALILELQQGDILRSI